MSDAAYNFEPSLADLGWSESWEAAFGELAEANGFEPARVVRVRRAGPKGALTVKGLTTGVERAEFEYAIPPEDADAMLDGLCLRPLLEKTRYREPFGGRTWEIDVFEGENAGLVVAEVELSSSTDKLELPPWAGKEVSDDPRYFNSNLTQHPYTRWGRGD